MMKENIKLFDDFWVEMKEKHSVIGLRNADYMTWRYLDLSRRDYLIYMDIENGQTCGYVVERITRVDEFASKRDRY